MTSPEKIVRRSRQSLTPDQLERLDALAKLPDDTIDFSDIPEAGDSFFDNATQGEFFHPIKKQLTLRLDADLIDWFKRHTGTENGRGYQTRINRALREYVIEQQKKAG